MNWHLIEREIKWSAVTSRGPGGQNVNKVASAAQLTWPFRQSVALNEEQKNLLAEKLHTRINSLEEVYLRSDEYRDFPRNKERCWEKLQQMVGGALHKPKPRKATKPTRSARLKRKDSKRKRGETKRNRGKVSSYD
jgi:ribosome-associated protein